MNYNQSKIPRILSADDVANFRYLLIKYGFSDISGNISATGTINAGGGFKADGTAGVTASITIPKLTTGGSAGALTIKDGIITAASNPT
ncbi:MAG: hypothetical protein KGL39_15050 [Patescibacteria group bacterium]|nr:hypothetical protein [Patescibacteria group bacterium]